MLISQYQTLTLLSI